MMLATAYGCWGSGGAVGWVIGMMLLMCVGMFVFMALMHGGRHGLMGGRHDRWRDQP